MSNPVFQKIESLLKDYPEALDFLTIFHDLCHRIDDIIDEKNTNSEFIINSFICAAGVYSCKFYRDNVVELFPLVCHISNTFADSVIMENSSIDWQRNFGDAIRNCANDMVVYVVAKLCGWQQAREISMLLREDSYLKHHTENGLPI